MAPSIKNAHAEVDFTGLPPGKYAAGLLSRREQQREVRSKTFGMPKEGYCFSNNVKPKLSAPKFDECAFDYKGGDQSISITMIYSMMRDRLAQRSERR